LIESAIGKAAYVGDLKEEGDDLIGDDDALEAEMTIAAAS
jgi:hypothetical protein